MEQTSLVKTIKKVLPAVVSITVSKYLTVFENPFGAVSPRGGGPFFNQDPFFMVPKGKKKIQVGGGSGFIVGSTGIILTNRHVVADPKAEYVAILGEEKKYKAEILAKDPVNDIAIIKIDAKNLPVIKLGDSANLDLGEQVIAIGNTLGTFRNTVSSGVVSGLSRQITAMNDFDRRPQRLRGLIQTDAAINPGNSGGPLINIKGEAIGINAAMVFGAENVGFALPINTAKKDLKDLKKYGKIRNPFLGIRYVLLNRELQEKFNLPVSKGAWVVSEKGGEEMSVVRGGPADRAGIRGGDIILEIQKEKITIKNFLEDIIQKFKVGQAVDTKVLRNGREINFNIILGERK